MSGRRSSSDPRPYTPAGATSYPSRGQPRAISGTGRAASATGRRGHLAAESAGAPVSRGRIAGPDGSRNQRKRQSGPSAARTRGRSRRSALWRRFAAVAWRGSSMRRTTSSGRRRGAGRTRPATGRCPGTPAPAPPWRPSSAAPSTRCSRGKTRAGSGNRLSRRRCSPADGFRQSVHEPRSAHRPRPCRTSGTPANQRNDTTTIAGSGQGGFARGTMNSHGRPPRRRLPDTSIV